MEGKIHANIIKILAISATLLSTNTLFYGGREAGNKPQTMKNQIRDLDKKPNDFIIEIREDVESDDNNKAENFHFLSTRMDPFKIDFDTFTDKYGRKKRRRSFLEEIDESGDDRELCYGVSSLKKNEKASLLSFDEGEPSLLKWQRGSEKEKDEEINAQTLLQSAQEEARQLAKIVNANLLSYKKEAENYIKELSQACFSLSDEKLDIDMENMCMFKENKEKAFTFSRQVYIHARNKAIKNKENLPQHYRIVSLSVPGKIAIGLTNDDFIYAIGNKILKIQNIKNSLSELKEPRIKIYTEIKTLKGFSFRKLTDERYVDGQKRIYSVLFSLNPEDEIFGPRLTESFLLKELLMAGELYKDIMKLHPLVLTSQEINKYQIEGDIYFHIPVNGMYKIRFNLFYSPERRRLYYGINCTIYINMSNLKTKFIDLHKISMKAKGGKIIKDIEFENEIYNAEKDG